MHNVWLIAKREYLERVRTKAFMLSTILIPVLMGGGIVGSIIASSKARSTSHITIVSQDQQLATDLQAELQSGKDSKMTVDVISPGDSATHATLDGMLADKQLDGYLWITPAAHPSERPRFSYTPRSAGDISTKGAITSALRTVLMREAPRPPGHGRLRRRRPHAARRGRHYPGRQERRHHLQLRRHLCPLLPHVHGHHALRHERRALHHRRKNLPRLRGPPRHHQARRDDGRQDDRRRLRRSHAGGGLACYRSHSHQHVSGQQHRRRQRSRRTQRHADRLLHPLLHPRLHALLQHRRRAGRDGQLRAGAATAKHVPRHAAHRLFARHRCRSSPTPAESPPASSRSSPSAPR